MNLFDEVDEHASPLSPDERLGLRLPDITYRHELNQAEFDNIAKGAAWAWRRRGGILTEAFVVELHRRMFGDVWSWAGTFSRENKRRIGVDSYEIPVRLRAALDEAKAWRDYKSFPVDEIAVRFHVSLVSIHPFPNGNGRWSRMMADLLAVRLGAERFTWASAGEPELLSQQGNTRARYMAALLKAVGHDVSDLIAFARS